MGPTEPPMAFSCPGANPATVLQEIQEHMAERWEVSSRPPRGKNKQTDFLKAVEQHPDHVFAINPELP